MKENDLLYNLSKNYSDFCSKGIGNSYLWLGANDVLKERTWMYHDTETPIAWEGPWRGDGPNGGTVENCLVMLRGDFASKWSDMACLASYYFCVPCELQDHVPLYLKGPVLCSTSPFNEEYFISELKNDKPLISGTLHSEIYWDTQNKSWVLKSLKVYTFLYFESLRIWFLTSGIGLRRSISSYCRRDVSFRQKVLGH